MPKVKIEIGSPKKIIMEDWRFYLSRMKKNDKLEIDLKIPNDQVMCFVDEHIAVYPLKIFLEHTEAIKDITDDIVVEYVEK